VANDKLSSKCTDDCLKQGGDLSTKQRDPADNDNGNGAGD
jgi:hypothetical protein